MVFYNFGKKHPSTTELDFDGAEGNVEFGGDFFVGHFVEVTKANNAFVTRRKTVDQLAYKVVALADDEVFLGGRVCRGDGVLVGLVVFADRDGAEGDEL